ncbi:hypothetical protein E4U61_002687, partial [Claviceps capensis]
MADSENSNSATPSQSPILGVTNIQSLPPSVLYDSFDGLLTFLQTWARSNGVASVKRDGFNRREVNGTKIATHWILYLRSRTFQTPKGL